MEVAILTVGDEVLAGDIENSNATWLAAQLSELGSTVVRILTVPDDRDLIATTVADWGDEFDAVIVTGGLGGTHDDVTIDAIADAFDRDLVVEDTVQRDVVRKAAEFRDLDPETTSAADIDLDVPAWAALPTDSRALLNPEGLCPGCVLENVYVFPGVPAEVKALFELVASEFDGDAITATLYTDVPEASVVDALPEIQDHFDVIVGSYPSTDDHNRVKIIGTDGHEVTAAADWLGERLPLIEGR